MGLVESAHIVAGALGWKLDRVDETLEPAIAPRDLDTEYLRIPAGAAAGIKQAVRAYRGGELAISLDLQVYVGAESPRDHVLVDGDPPVDATIAGGVNGELAAAAVLLNSLPEAAGRPGRRADREGPAARPLAEPPGAGGAPSPETLERGIAGPDGMNGDLAEGVVPDLLREIYVGRRSGTLTLVARRRAAEPALPARAHRERAHERPGGAARRDARAPGPPLARPTSPAPPRSWCARGGGSARS